MPALAKPLAITPHAPPDFTREDTDRLPRSHALVAFDHADGSTIQCLTTSDARDLAESRLLNAHPSPRADLASVTAQLRAWPASCSLEADLLYARLAPKLIPNQLDAIRATNTVHLLTADPTEQHPRFRSFPSTAEIPDTPVVGPFTTRKRAERFAEDLVDLFELCRKHELLVLAPNATACLYKELGTCPAACDGSETMGAYRARFTEALDLARSHPDRPLMDLHAAMNEASAALDFETAERLRKRIATLTKMRAEPNHLAADLREATWLATSKTADGKSRYAALIRAGRVAAEHTAPIDAPASKLAEPLASAEPPHTPDLFTIELLTRRFARRDPRDPARLTPLPSADPHAVAAAIAVHAA